MKELILVVLVLVVFGGVKVLQSRIDENKFSRLRLLAFLVCLPILYWETSPIWPKVILTAVFLPVLFGDLKRFVKGALVGMLLCSSTVFGQGIPYVSSVGPAHPRDLSAQMIDEQAGYILTFLDSTRTQTQLYATTNSAVSWSTRAMRGISSEGNGLHLGVHFYTTQIGIYLTQNKVYRTVNGGDDWLLVQNLSGAYTMCHYGDTSYITGSGGNYYRTYDAGNQWTARNWSDGYPVIIGCACDEEAVMLWSLPNVQSSIQPAVRMEHGEVAAYNYGIAMHAAFFENRGFAANHKAFSALDLYRFVNGSLFITSDGGVSQLLRPQTVNGAFSYANLFSWVDSLHGFMVAENKIFKTVDGGQNWQLLLPYSGLQGVAIQPFCSPYGQFLHLAVLPMPDSSGNQSLEVVTIPGFQGLSTAKEGNLTAIVVYPNPVLDALYFKGLSSGESYQIQLFDAAGKEVMRQLLNHATAQIEVSDLRQGLYFYQLKSDQGWHTGRFVKQ